ncbi:MAG TPA: hypothetical protein VF488_04920, partial [Gemmatimonadaceae bacterium]
RTLPPQEKTMTTPRVSKPTPPPAVDLEHRHLERHGPDADKMRAGVDAPNGWGGSLARFAAEAER